MNLSLDPEPDALVISNDAGRVLLRLDRRAENLDGTIEDMGEAAAIFVHHVRAMLGMPASAQSAPPADDVREALARTIDPEAWRDVQPHSEAFHDDADAQARYEGFFWEGVRGRRAPSLDAADRILTGAAFEVRPRGTVTDAEVERVALLLWADYDAEHAGSAVDQFFGQARRLLEAAREAHS